MADLASDLALSQAVTPRPITEVAAGLGLADHLEPVGRYAGKIALAAIPPAATAAAASARYVVVTAITPTPLGEGKTVTSIGLTMALAALGRRAIVCLRQPSAGPVFGIKGGGAGGGRAQIVPWETITFHGTGDSHAVGAAHNLLSAFIDNHIHHGNKLNLDPSTIVWPRVLDVCDRALADVRLQGGRPEHARLSAFEITAASELMAILALAGSIRDMRARIGRMVVAQDRDGQPITAEQIGCAGSMAVLMRDALKPSLMQTMEGAPALIHAGPFGNIAHGNSSILADHLALPRAEFVVTEAGFGADLGFEKFCHIKCRASGLRPHLAVLVCTVRGLKFHSGKFDIVPGKPTDPGLSRPDDAALSAGSWNLRRQIANVRAFGTPVVVAINRFPTDTDAELDLVRRVALDAGAVAAVPSTLFAAGSEGGRQLAEAVIRAAGTGPAPHLRLLYSLDAPIPEKLDALARTLYGADGVSFDAEAAADVERWTRLGYGALPVCVAKTQYSLSHEPKMRVDPRGYAFRVRRVRLSAGAGFLYAVAGAMKTMPGLPSAPLGAAFDVDDDGRVVFRG